FKPYDYGASVARFKRIGEKIDDPDAAANSRWRSVRIRPGLIACGRVSNLTGQVFLAREAPELPLPNCTERDCHCHYVFLDDRRSGADRRTDLAGADEFLSGNQRDRRHSPGRREGDLVAA
ncbi:MAG: hypothetical protein JSU67_04565, partial [Gammaproteobacteria bacterium]